MSTPDPTQYQPGITDFPTATTPQPTTATTTPDTSQPGAVSAFALTLAKGDPALAQQIQDALDSGDIATLQSLVDQANAAVNPLLQAASDLYFNIWGQPPPSTDYIQGLIDQGLNLYEIQQHEMDKPGFALTNQYRDKASGYAQIASSVFARR